MVALASPWRGMVLAWPGKLEVVDVNVDEGGCLAGRVAEGETGADSDYHIGGLHDLVKLVHLLPFTRGLKQEP